MTCFLIQWFFPTLLSNISRRCIHEIWALHDSSKENLLKRIANIIQLISAFHIFSMQCERVESRDENHQINILVGIFLLVILFFVRKNNLSTGFYTNVLNPRNLHFQSTGLNWSNWSSPISNIFQMTLPYYTIISKYFNTTATDTKVASWFVESTKHWPIEIKLNNDFHICFANIFNNWFIHANIRSAIIIRSIVFVWSNAFNSIQFHFIECRHIWVI